METLLKIPANAGSRFVLFLVLLSPHMQAEKYRLVTTLSHNKILQWELYHIQMSDFLDCLPSLLLSFVNKHCSNHQHSLVIVHLVLLQSVLEVIVLSSSTVRNRPSNHRIPSHESRALSNSSTEARNL